MRIFLIGYMASGKSTVVKKLAKKLELTAVDLDAEIIEAEGMPIPEVFRNKGETAFRRAEQRQLRKWMKQDDFVMACGGGTPCYFESMDEMNAAGTTVYLKMSPKALVDRVLNSKEERPILKGLSPEKMLEKVEKQLGKREPFYERSAVIVNGLDLDVDALVKKLTADSPQSK